ncbi:MAG: hypothetical protein ACOCXI_17190, partial [Chloroflexota bacterium]
NGKGALAPLSRRGDHLVYHSEDECKTPVAGFQCMIHGPPLVHVGPLLFAIMNVTGDSTGGTASGCARRRFITVNTAFQEQLCP